MSDDEYLERFNTEYWQTLEDVGVDALSGGYAHDAVLRIEVTDPMPFTLIALLPRLRVNQS